MQKIPIPFLFLVSILLAASPARSANLPLLMEGIPDQLYRAQGPVDADGKEILQARQQLRREAAKMDADAVVAVGCQAGGLKRQGLTWVREQAHCRGMAVKFVGGVREIEPQQLQAFIKNHPGTQVVDVREDWERKKAKIPNTQHIPLGQISSAQNQLNADKPVITYCKTGRRSLQAAEILNKMGFLEVYTLKGGIKAYSIEVDSSIPKY